MSKKDSSVLYEVIDAVLFPHQINKLLDEAILLVNVMREGHHEMYPANLKRLFPNETEEFWHLGAKLLNDLAFND